MTLHDNVRTYGETDDLQNNLMACRQSLLIFLRLQPPPQFLCFCLYIYNVLVVLKKFQHANFLLDIYIKHIALFTVNLRFTYTNKFGKASSYCLWSQKPTYTAYSGS